MKTKAILIGTLLALILLIAYSYFHLGEKEEPPVEKLETETLPPPEPPPEPQEEPVAEPAEPLPEVVPEEAPPEEPPFEEVPPEIQGPWNTFVKGICTECADFVFDNYPEYAVEILAAFYLEYPAERTHIGNHLVGKYGEFMSHSRTVKEKVLLRCIHNIDIETLKSLLAEESFQPLSEAYLRRRQKEMPEDFLEFVKETCYKFARQVNTVDFDAEVLELSENFYAFEDEEIESQYSKQQKFIYRLGKPMATALKKKALGLAFVLQKEEASPEAQPAQ